MSCQKNLILQQPRNMADTEKAEQGIKVCFAMKEGEAGTRTSKIRNLEKRPRGEIWA